MVTTPSKPISLEEFLALAETKDGKIIHKPIPQEEHSTIRSELIIALNGAFINCR